MSYNRVVCLTEESLEILFRLNLGPKVVGISRFACRPEEVNTLPKVCGFTNANIEKILNLKPDLVLGFSDLQKEIAADLIGKGINVFIANHRSVAQILDYTLSLGRLFDQKDAAIALVQQCHQKIEAAKQFSQTLKKRPIVLIEEWDEPLISGIEWFSEIVELCGGIDIGRKKNKVHGLAKDRIFKESELINENIDYVFACWCGKKVDKQKIQDRPFLKSTSAIVHNRVFELEPAIFLQPGVAPILDGLEIIQQIFLSTWSEA